MNRQDFEQQFEAISDQIWEFAETRYQEFRSRALQADFLEKEGFTVERGIGGMKTAFVGTYGSGKPVIGILAEYDALSGLFQIAGCTEEKPLKEGGSGHGCGHNILGAGAMAAAFGVKAYLEQNHTAGTVILYGCPGEEGGAAKAFMARDGVWKNLDAALTWHPDDVNEVATGSSNACIQTQYKFHGIASHAAGAPEMGRIARGCANGLAHALHHDEYAHGDHTAREAHCGHGKSGDGIARDREQPVAAHAVGERARHQATGE